MMFVYVQNCVRVVRTANVLMVRVQNYECVACAGTGAANAYTKRDCAQMFVQARNNEHKYNNKRIENVFNTGVVLNTNWMKCCCSCARVNGGRVGFENC